MNFSTLPAWSKLAVGAAGAFAVVGGTVGLTAAVVGSSVNGSSVNGSSAAPSATPYAPAPATSSPTPAPSPNPAARVVAVAVLDAEAHVLGIQPAQLRADFRAGTTVQALAAQKSITETQFEAQLSADLKPMLDQNVQQGSITSAHEHLVLRRVARAIPNWDHVGAGRQQPTSSPTP